MNFYTPTNICFDQRVETFFEDDFDLGDSKYESTKQLIEELLHHVYKSGSLKHMESCLQELACLWNLDTEFKDSKLRTAVKDEHE